MKDRYDFSKGKRGPVVKGPEGKEKISIRIDRDILDWFRNAVNEAGGGNYQTLINDALRKYVEGNLPSFGDAVRRIVREELAAKR